MLRAIASMLCLVVLGIAPPSARAEPVRRALLIGIDEYQSDDISDLRGAVNDVTALRALLSTHFGFSDDRIRIVTDAQGTRAAILAALQDITKEAGSGDIVYVHYSGHGSQVADKNGDERDDKRDETIVPHDGRLPNIPDITDDEIGSILSGLRTGEALVVLDSCHSGTGTRGIEAFRTRWVPPDTRTELYVSATTRGLSDELDYVLMTGASPAQSALDGPIDGIDRGFFSYALVNALDKGGAGASPNALMERVRESFQQLSLKFDGLRLPDPQLEGPTARLGTALFPSLADAAAASQSYLVVKPERRGTVRLVQGAASTGSTGSTWAIYAPGERAFTPGKALATAQVTGMSGADALAALDPDDAVIAPDSRGVQIAPTPAARTLSVNIRADAPIRTQLAEALKQQRSTVEVVAPSEFALFMIVVEATCSNCRPQVSLLDATGLQERDRFDWTDAASAAKRLDPLLGRSASAADLTSISNPSARMRLDVHIVTNADNRGIKVVSSGTTARYRIRKDDEPRSYANSLALELRASTESYITIVDIDSEGHIVVMFPNALQRPGYYPEGRIAAGETVRIPDSLADANAAGFHWDYAVSARRRHHTGVRNAGSRTRQTYPPVRRKDGCRDERARRGAAGERRAAQRAPAG